ncbi:MAG: adenylyltransferase/cytidyltransferase family protein [Chitinophagales bacterium]
MSHPKIVQNIADFLSKIERKNNTIVFTNGCFDLLHEGHLHLLKEAKKLGTILLVAVNEDASVQRLKGNTRPIESLEIRMQKLAEISEVDYIISFSEDTPFLLIKTIQPNILVKGGDYKMKEVVGREFVQQVVLIPLLAGYSTTKLIERKHNL